MNLGYRTTYQHWYGDFKIHGYEEMSFNKANILVIAEGNEQSTLLTEALTSSGHYVVTAESGARALSILERQTIDIVLADVGLAELDCSEFCQTVKELHPDLPIIMITGPSEPATVQIMEKTGFISKPFRISHIEKLIGSLLNEKSSPGGRPFGGIVLVVDDDDAFRTMLIRSLQLSGYKAMGAADGKMAFEMLESGGIGTVIADINMPYMDGVTLMKKIRQGWPGIPVILITGYYSADDNSAVGEDQPDGFLMKPFRVQHIDELLKSVLYKKIRP